MSKSRLSEIERGESALESISEIVALADVLQIAPSELMRLPVPAPANGHTDSTTEAVRLALDAIEVGHQGRLVPPVAVLRDRRLAHEHGAATTVGVATFGVVDVLAGGGVFEPALTELDGITLPATTADMVGLVYALTVRCALFAVVAGRPGDADAPDGRSR
ncbi:MAG: helix-turn-helix domain-containing protein [Pseudonocardiaceae bacterium]